MANIIEDIFKLTVDASGVTQGVGSAEEQINRLRRAIIDFIAAGGSAALSRGRGLDALFRRLAQEGNISKSVIDQVRRKLLQIKDVQARAQIFVDAKQAEKEAARIEKIVQTSAKEAAAKAQAELDAQPLIFQIDRASAVKQAEDTIRQIRNRISTDPVVIERTAQGHPADVDKFGKEVSRAALGETDLQARIQLQRVALKQINDELALLINRASQEKTINKEIDERIKKLQIAGRQISASVETIPQDQLAILPDTAKSDIETVRRLKGSVNNLSQSYIDHTSEIKKASQETGKFSQTNKSLTSVLGNAVVKIIKYRVAFVSMRAAIEGLKSSLDTFSDLQLELAKLEKVVDPLTTDMAKFKDEAFGLARAFSTTAEEVLKSFTIFAQTGLEQAEVIEATKAALVGLNSIGLSSKEVTDALTAVIFTYNVAAEESINVLSKWIAVQREFPISAQDLANSLKVIGAAAQVVGVDIDDLAGSVAAIGAITRKSGTAIGQSLKTIFARLPKKETVKVFEEFGISVFKSATEIRDFDDVLSDLAKQWPILTSAQKANIATTIGGIRRYADFVALMDNFAVKQQATVISQQASTEAIKAADLELITLSKTLDRTRALFEELGFIVGSQLAKPLFAIVSLFDSFRSTFGDKGVKIVAALITGFTGLVVILGSLIVAVKLAVAAKASLIATIASLNGVEIAATGATATLSAALKEAGVSAGIFGASINAVKVALGPVGAIMAAIGVVLAAVGVGWAVFGEEAKRASTDVEELVDSLEAQTLGLIKANQSIEKQSEFVSDTIDAIEQYQRVLSNTEKGTKEYEESNKKLLIVLDGIKASTPKVVDEIDKFKRSFDIAKQSTDGLRDALLDVADATEILKKENELLIKQNIAKIRARIAINDRDVAGAKTAIENIQKELDFDNLNLGGDVEVKIFDPTSIEDFTTQALLDLNSFKKRADDIAGDNEIATKALQVPFDELEARIQTLKERAPILIGDILQGDDLARNAASSELERLLLNVGDGGKRAGLIFKESLATGLGVASAEGTKLTQALNRLEDAQRGISSSQEGIVFGGDVSRKLQSFKDQVTEIINEFGRFNDKTLLDQAKKLLDPIEEFSEFDFSEKGVNSIISAFSSLTNNIDDEIKLVQNRVELLNQALSVLKSPTGTQTQRDQEALNILKQNVQLSERLAETGLDNKITIEGVTEELKKQTKEEEGFLSLKTQINSLDSQALDIKSEINSKLVEEFRLTNRIAAANRVSNQAIRNAIDSRLNIIAATNDELTLISESTRANLAVAQNEFALRERILNITSGIKDEESVREERIASANQLLQDQARILEQEVKKRAEQALKPILEGINEFKSALSSGFSDIPDIFSTGADKREEIQREIKDIELDIQKARNDGDQQALFDAERRKVIAQQELDQYKRGLFEISKIADKIFGSLSSSFWKKITDDFVESISNIAIGDTSLAGKFGEIFGKVGSDFTRDFSAELRDANREHRIALIDINNKYLQTLSDILQVNVPLIGGGSFTGERIDGLFVPDAWINNSDSTDQNTVTLQELTKGQKALISALNLASATFGQALFGGNRASSLGAQTGGLFGAAGLEQLLGKNAFQSLRAFGGPLGLLGGTLVGGLLGSLFGGKTEEPERRFVEEISKNTDAIISNTLALKQLNQAVFNAPTGFNVPVAQSGFGRSVEININGGGNARELAEQISNIIASDFGVDAVTFGSRETVNI